MTQTREEGYWNFLKLAAAILIGLLALGYLPTANSAGSEGIPAMVIGSGVSLVASIIGTLPILLSPGRTPVDLMPAILGAILLRLAAIVVITTAVVWSGNLPTRPLLIWVAISHAGLLVADTLYARGRIRALSH